MEYGEESGSQDVGKWSVWKEGDRAIWGEVIQKAGWSIFSQGGCRLQYCILGLRHRREGRKSTWRHKDTLRCEELRDCLSDDLSERQEGWDWPLEEKFQKSYCEIWVVRNLDQSAWRTFCDWMAWIVRSVKITSPQHHLVTWEQEQRKTWWLNLVEVEDWQHQEPKAFKVH